MKNILSNKYLLLLSRIILGTIFVIASIDKIVVPEVFALNVQAYNALPIPLVNFVALIIPWIELVCGIFLIAKIFSRSTSLLISSLLCLFIVLLISAIIRGLTIDCGCFGASHTSPVGWARVFEDIGLLLLGIHIFYFSNRSTEQNIVEI